MNVAGRARWGASGALPYGLAIRYSEVEGSSEAFD